LPELPPILTVSSGLPLEREITLKNRQITPNILQLTEAHFVNAYLVREEDGFTLIDTGLGRGAKAFVTAAREGGAPIVRVALTHGHADHAGAVDKLKALLGDVTIYLGDLDARILAGEPVITGKKRGSWAKLTSTPDVLLTGEERIGSLQVIPCPGHTPGHMAFLDPRESVLFGGDTFTTYWRTEIPNRLRQRFPLAAMGTQDRDTIISSAKTLADIESLALAIGHGPVVHLPQSAMRAAIRRAEAARA
jgi:glyoxylase-like metal-dependent hydrolase (beta-lactamase superfamily II)